MINYQNQKVEANGCLGCSYANHEFSLPCGMAYEDETFTLSQDWEVPIPGFLIASPKRHLETFMEMTKEERIEIFELVNETMKILRENQICERFDVIFEEKPNHHFHIWILPRYDWMQELVGDITDNLGKVFEYAKINLKTKENFQAIEEITQLVKNKLVKEEKNATN